MTRTDGQQGLAVDDVLATAQDGTVPEPERSAGLALADNVEVQARDRSRILMRAIACAALLAGCAPRPLRTPELTPTNACPQGTGTPVALAGFEREHGAILRVPLAQLLEEHGYRIVATPADAAIVVSLDDLFAQVTSAATARRWANIYFTATLLAAWMMPIMSGSGAYDSTVEIEAWLSVRSTRSERSPVRDVKRATATERPSGFPGETDPQFAARVLDRIGANLAVAFFDERCGALVP